MGLIIRMNSVSTPMAFPWRIRYSEDKESEDKASIRGAIVPRAFIKRT
jgi:hypothetical protein